MASSSEVSGELPGLAVGGKRHRHAVAAERVDGRQLRLAQEIERAGQEHRDRAGLRHGRRAGFVGIFEVIGGERAEAGRERRAVEVGELVGMQFYAQAERAGCGEEAGDLVGAEGDALAETVDGVDQALGHQRRQDFCNDAGYIRVLVAVRFRRQGMQAQIGRGDLDRPQLGEPSGRAQLARFRFEIEAIARFDLDRRDALGDQRVEARQRLRDELVNATPCASRAPWRGCRRRRARSPRSSRPSAAARIPAPGRRRRRGACGSR